MRDIIKPPILPKIIDFSEKIVRTAKFRNSPLNEDKTLSKFVNNMYNEEINLPLINLEKVKEI